MTPKEAKIEYLFTVAMEEASEVAKEISKAKRFGLDDSYNGKTCRERIFQEMLDLVTVFDMLEEEGVAIGISGLNSLNNWKHREAKRKRVIESMEYSRERKIIVKSFPSSLY